MATWCLLSTKAYHNKKYLNTHLNCSLLVCPIPLPLRSTVHKMPSSGNSMLVVNPSPLGHNINGEWQRPNNTPACRNWVIACGVILITVGGGARAGQFATHDGLSCGWSEGRHHSHAAINDIIHRVLTSANTHLK